MSLKCLLRHKKLRQIHAQLIKTQNPKTLNPLLKSLTNSQNPQNALLMYSQMILLHNHNNPPCHNHYTFTYALKACTALYDHKKGLEIHGHVIKTGHHYDLFIRNTLLHFYVTQNDIVSASKVFDEMPCRNVVSWSLIISGLSKTGFEEEAIAKFSCMDVEPNAFTLVSVVSACSGMRALNLGRAVHGYRLRNFIESNAILDNTILDFYTKCGSLCIARQLFDKMPERDVFSWTTMIGGYAQRGFCEEAVRLFRAMIEGREAEPDEATLVNLMSACSLGGASNLGEWIESYIIGQSGLVSNGNAGNALINMYVKCGHLGNAVRVFDAVGNKEDVVSWTTVMSGMAMSGRGKQVLQLFALMLVHGVRPDGVAFVGLLSACSHAGLVKQGLKLFSSMRRIYGIEPRAQHYACVVDMYGRAGLLEAAERFIREMPIEADVPIWGSLLNACKIHGDNEMFERSRARVFGASGEVSIGTRVLVPNAYAGCGRWDEAVKARNEISGSRMRKMAGYSRIKAEP